MEEIDTISKTVDEGKDKKKKKKKKTNKEEKVDEDQKGREGVPEPIQLPPIKISKSITQDEKEEEEEGNAEEDDKKRLKKDSKKKKKKKKTGLDEENEALEQKLNEREMKRKKKKKTSLGKRRRNSVLVSEEEALEDRIRDPALALVLRNLEDDIHILQGSLTPRVSASSSPLPPPVSSTHVNKVFTEKANGGFANTVKRPQQSGGKAVRLSSVDPHNAELLLLPPPMKHRKTPLELGMDTQKAFRSFGIFCHGFLAGMAFWHLVTVIVLTWGEDDVLDFIALYSPLSQPVQCIFYFLAVVCTISIMDRYDLAMFDWRQLQQLLTFRSGGLALVVYFSTLVVNLSTANLDDKISLYKTNATIFERMEDEDLAYEFHTWKSLNCCRSVGFILGWFLVSLRPNTDLLHKHLRRLGGNSGKLFKSTPMKLLGMENGESKIKY